MYNEKNTNTGFSNDKGSFVNLLTANYYRIHAYILSMVPNDSDVDDIMQETVTLMWQNFDRFQAGTNFISWAVTIAKFQVLRYQKQRKRSRLVLSEEVYDLLISENHAIQEQSHERFRALRECLQKLPEKEQDFIKMRYMDGATAKIVAQKIGASIDAVYRRGAKLNDMLLRCVRASLTGVQV